MLEAEGMIRVVELFAGIGAQRMALMQAGIPHEVVGIAEINKHAVASYGAIYGDCPNLGDVTKIERLPPCDLLTYSFPCQDLSVAGKRKGMGEGTRSGLVWEVLRLLEDAEERPGWLLMENVPQVLTAPEWPTLLSRLEAMGYHNRWAKLDSSRFGSAQKRVRAFMVSRMGEKPPELPTEDPGAPMLCLKDIMEPERGEKYVKKIPLDRIRWREPKKGNCLRLPKSMESTPVAEDMRESFYSRAMLYSSSSSSPTIRTFHSLNDMVKVVDGRPGSSTPIAEINGVIYYPERSLYSPQGSSPTVCTDHGNNRIQVIVDIDRPTHLDYQNRLYSPIAAAPSLIAHGGSDHEVKVVADDMAISWEWQARIYSKDGLCPTVTDLGRRGREFLKVANGKESGGAMDGETEDGCLTVNVLTPRECWRLMGFPEWAYLRASKVSSETQLYNQAGNSIVVEVLEAIFRTMFSDRRVRRQTGLAEFSEAEA